MPGEGAGERIDALSERWDASPALQLVAPVVCVAWQAMMFTRLAFLGADGSRAFADGGAFVALALMAASCLALFARRRRPCGVAAVEAGVVVAGSLIGIASHLVLPVFVAAYTLAARAAWKRAIVGTAGLGCALALAGVLDDALAGGSAPTLASVLTLVLTFLVVVFVAFLSHARFDRRREARQAAERDRAQRAEAQRLAAARDAALARGRIAAELHDSVGHDLTAIVALSEGLADGVQDAELARAAAMINKLARAGLADTRRAVRALAAREEETGAGVGAKADAASAQPEGRSGAPVDPAPLHAWDEVRDVLEAVRATGIAAMLTETGRRAPDARQADLAFRISREAATNALRHGADVSRISVAWDHGDDGSCAVTVRDNGRGSAASAQRQTFGTGLARLADATRAAGGTFQAGFEPTGGWCVRATVPPIDGKGTA